MEKIKVMVIGDYTVGKTCLLIRYATNSFPIEYIPTVFENYNPKIMYKTIEVVVGLWDTAGNEGYHTRRFMSYPQTNVFLLCYSIINKDTFTYIDRYWKEELNQFAKDVPIILVGTKSDYGKKVCDTISCEHNHFREVSMKEGVEMALKIKASYFIEVSAKTGENVDNLFENVLHIGLKDKLVHLKTNKKEKCVVC